MSRRPKTDPQLNEPTAVTKDEMHIHRQFSETDERHLTDKKDLSISISFLKVQRPRKEARPVSIPEAMQT